VVPQRGESKRAVPYEKPPERAVAKRG
jgi:hypothetical protein